MSSDVVDTVAVRLVADASELLDQADEAINQVESAGEEAGRLFAESFGRGAQQIGQQVRQLAEQLGTDFQAAAAELGGQGLLEGFSEEQAAAFAEGLDRIGVPLEALADEFELTNEQVSAFGIATAEAMGILQEGGGSVESFTGTMEGSEELLERMNAAIGTLREQAGALSEEEAQQVTQVFEILAEAMSEGGEVTEELVEIFEQYADVAKEANDANELVEQQVRKVVEGFREMGIEIPNALQRERIRQYVRRLQELEDQFSDVEGEANQFTDELLQQAQASTEAEGVLGQLIGGFDVFGISIGDVVSGLGVGAVAFKLIQSAIGAVQQQIRESIDVALTFAESQRDLAAAVRVNTVAGMENNLTFQDWQATAETVAEVANTSLQVGMDTVTRALRELGAATDLSDDQIQEIIITGSEFADLYGVKLPAGINQVSRFITTGLSESLRNLGLRLDKTAQNQKAFELNLGTSIDELSEAEQEAVRYALVLEQLQERTEAAGGDTETLTDRMEALERRSETAKRTLGTIFLPFTEKLEELKVGLEEAFTGIFGFIALGFITIAADITAGVLSLIATMTFFGDQIQQGIVPSLKEVGDVASQSFSQAREELIRIGVDRITGDFEEMEQSAQGASGSVDDLSGEISDLADNVGKFVEEAAKFDEGMAKIQRRLDDALSDITDTFNRKRAEAETDLQRDLRDLDRDAALDRMEAIRDFQIDEIRLREDHAKDIRQLEDRFLLDLEDAVRDRDARGVLQLQRRFNLEKKRREEDFLLQQKRRKEDFQFELQDIERARQLRRQARILAFQEEMSDLAAQEQVRREAAQLRAQRAERELLAQIKARLEALAGAAAQEVGIQIEQLDALNAALTAIYGPEGPWVEWHRSAVEALNESNQAVAQGDQALLNELARTEGAVRAHLAFMNAAASQSQTVQQRITAAGGGERRFRQGVFGARFGFRQRGGSFVATSAGMVGVGEGRPERVDITPLSQSTGQPSAGFEGGGGQQDRMAIDLNVEASDQLVVEVADQTMSEVADVFVNISSRGMQGGRGA